MTREQFNSVVIMAVEIEAEDGHRFWETMTADEVDAYIDKWIDLGYYFSDCDYCTKQTDATVRKILNLADLNWFKNHEWCKANGLDSFDKVIDYILEKGLY